MGGCCCCATRQTEPATAPPYYYRSLEEHLPLSSQRGSAISAVDTNLDTSIPDTFRAPPAPMPYDVAIGRPISAPPARQEICDDKNGGGGADRTTNSDSVQEAGGGGGGRGNDNDVQDPSAKCEDLKGSDCKGQADCEVDATKESDAEPTKPVESRVLTTEEEDVCPICLEEYDTDNPKLITKCDHHFHLACILEWMERSDTCPVCDQEMIFEHPDETSQFGD